MSDHVLPSGDAPDDDLADEGGPTQAGEERWEATGDEPESDRDPD